MNKTLLGLLWFLSMDVMASILVTADSQTAQNVAMLMMSYREAHGGQLPTTWNQINELIDSDTLNKGMVMRYGYKIEDRYVFVTQPMSLDEQAGTQVLLIRTIPLQDRKPMLDGKYQRYRYLVYMFPDGSISCGWFTEKSVQKMLNKAGVTITPKPGLPEFEYDQRPLDYVPPAEGTTKPWVPPAKATTESPVGIDVTPALQPKAQQPPNVPHLVTIYYEHGWIVWGLAIIAALVVFWRLLLNRSAK